MNKISKILLSIILIIIVFGLSAFGMYKYNEIKVFNNLADQGKQYMIQKDYDKAIQIFQQALSYKNDSNIKRNIALAQNLKNEENKKGIISKNIQLANDAAKNNKYDEANKYLDEILKIDSNNSDAKNLKDTFAKTSQDQQEKPQPKTQSETQKTNSNTSNISFNNSKQPYGSVRYYEAEVLVKNKYPGCTFKDAIDVLGKQGLARMVPAKYLAECYVFYGFDEFGEDFEGLVLVDTSTGKIFAIDPNGKIIN